MYGIFTYIYQILPLKTTKCREILPYMDGKGWEKSSFQDESCFSTGLDDEHFHPGSVSRGFNGFGEQIPSVFRFSYQSLRV